MPVWFVCFGVDCVTSIWFGLVIICWFVVLGFVFCFVFSLFWFIILMLLITGFGFPGCVWCGFVASLCCFVVNLCTCCCFDLICFWFVMMCVVFSVCLCLILLVFSCLVLLVLHTVAFVYCFR